ncbi:carcinoembryonic antigen-related cell adhesion molecule 1-like isoform X7 [Haliotis rubra]|uniref:carcinoembryonic antigen-related cell adhesion molecule 1-like isoform X7 n=1 Tax=Haliotis rubra TaxID=36100 RepID=UPI001EE505B1|nr:carcinoembryonic antigen-related cell adhesion molecule 1-like isoform X7 [Haliotis rubra]
MIIRCAANHSTITKPTGSGTCNSTCYQTDAITVFYTFSDSVPDVSSNPSGGTHTVGDTVTLKCNAVTNPPATYTWQKEGEDNSTLPGDELRLSHLKNEQSGTYTCLATNVVGGVTYTASKSLKINVVATTTSPHTTTATSTQRPSPGSTDAVKPEPPEVLDERPYTTLQRGASVPHEYGIIRNDTTQGTCTSQSKDGAIYEDCLTN